MIIFFFYFFDEETDTTVSVPVYENNVNTDEFEFIFEDNVRKVWHKQEDKWYFSVVDVCQVLTDSTNPRNYWNMLKARLYKEGHETYTSCVQLKLPASDGKMRKTDCASTKQLLHIIQFIPSKKQNFLNSGFPSLITD